MAFDCVTAERLKMPEISTVCVDGSWDHRRDEIKNFIIKEPFLKFGRAKE